MNALYLLRYSWVFGAVCLVMFALSGCAGYDTVKTAVATNGAKAADEELQAAEWGVCEATTMGAWQRRYGTQPDKVDGWRRLCTKAVTTP